VNGEGTATKKGMFLFTAFLACTVGMMVGLYGVQAKTDGEEPFVALQPAEESSAADMPRPAPDGTGKETALNDAEVLKPGQDKALPVAVSAEDTVKLGINPAGTGVPFSETDLEWVRRKSPGIQTVSSDQNQGKDIMDSLDPKVREVIEDTEEMVEEFDGKTLEVTAEILEAIPFLNLKPEKAEIRPEGGGAKLFIELSPEALGIGGKQDEKPSKVVSPDETGENQSGKPESADEGTEGTP